MSNRTELVTKMMAMQREFIKYTSELEGDFEMADYYTTDENHPLFNFREKYDALAMEVVNAAHAERGSKA